jgi:hypothetical protein
MNKQEAYEELKKISAELDDITARQEKLRAIIEAPEAVPPQVGRICFVSDIDSKCLKDNEIDLIKCIKGEWFKGQRCSWRYARIASWDELGVPWVTEAEKLIEYLADGPLSCESGDRAKRILAMRDGRTK